MYSPTLAHCASLERRCSLVQAFEWKCGEERVTLACYKSPGLSWKKRRGIINLLTRPEGWLGCKVTVEIDFEPGSLAARLAGLSSQTKNIHGFRYETMRFVLLKKEQYPLDELQEKSVVCSKERNGLRSLPNWAAYFVDIGIEPSARFRFRFTRGDLQPD
eukprot:744905-Pelagomonas_calceolata.AAC.1